MWRRLVCRVYSVEEGSMSRRSRWFATLVLVALAAPAAAIASDSGPTVTVKKWVLSTASGHTIKSLPSSTAHVCRSQKLIQLLIAARVTGAIEGQAYQERIFINGQKRD